MSSDKEYKTKHPCPLCGNRILIGRSSQVAEDCCEMWLECKNCNWRGNDMNLVETVYGWQEDYLYAAAQAWTENVEEHKNETA